MSDLLGLVPALVAGAGVFLIVAGLLNYMAPVAASPNATPSLGFGPSLSPSLLSPTPQGSRSPGPSSTGSATASPASAVATRVQVPALGIDLPVIASAPNETFPLCNVAEYFVDNSVAPPTPEPGCSCRSSTTLRSTTART
jgi:hypothetical protein